VHADEGAELSEPDNVGRVFGTAAGSRCARVAEGQVEGGLSFASFSLAAKENEDNFFESLKTQSLLNSFSRRSQGYFGEVGDLTLRTRLFMTQ